ncbi:MAG: hypothetical protein Q7U20_02935 [Caulobacter sp.]|nr:hypothetical protein [Caulobacter sp.]
MTIVGRAWSLLLPFIDGRARRLRLELARRWLFETARAGHNIIWFDEYILTKKEAASLIIINKIINNIGSRPIDEKVRQGTIDELAGVWTGSGVLSPGVLNSKAIEFAREEYLRVVSAHDRRLLRVSESYLDDLWGVFTKAHIKDQPVFRMASIDPGLNSLCNEWWMAALKITIAADEASVRMGLMVGEFFDWYRIYSVRRVMRSLLNHKADAKIVEFSIERNRAPFISSNDSDVLDDPTDQADLENLRKITYNFAGLIDYDQLCVFPKSRVPSVGCTVRNITNHLALLPARGVARAYLRRGDEQPLVSNEELNVLIIPFPYRIGVNAFTDLGAAQIRADGSEQSKWFSIEQEWLGSQSALTITNAVATLLTAAEDEVGKIHAVIFPELSLNYSVYAALISHIAHNFKNVELFIAGVSEKPKSSARTSGDSFENRVIKISDLSKFDDVERGNFVATTSFLTYTASEVRTYVTTFQAKHHRWKIDRGQIERYQISSKLSPKVDWWEDIETKTRSIEFTTFRGGSTLVSLSCEDLARLEPCQELIRAIGPNLVIALLMDGPQVVGRWSARYAMVLADDPGSSVLSFTSLGLMSRSNGSGRGNRTVALWKDIHGGTREIELPHGAHATVLKLVAQRHREITLDGRDDAGLAVTWRFQGAIPVYDDTLHQPLPKAFQGRI